MTSKVVSFPSESGGTFSRGRASGPFCDSSSPLDGVDKEVGNGILPLVVLSVILVVVFGAGVFLVYDAPAILSEAAFEFLLAAGLVKPVKRLDDPDWMGTVLRSTWTPFAIVLAVTTACAWLLHKHDPDAIQSIDLIR